MIETVTFFFELMGTIAFAISGAMVGIEKRMDILGISVLGMTTAVGGGILRDVILGNTPPQAFRNPIYLIIALVTSLAVFLPEIRRILLYWPSVYELVLRVMDAIGLGVFTVVGISVAHAAVPDGTIFLEVFVGVVTGVGGGVIRDILAGDMPFILVRHFYACASLIGALCCSVLWEPLGNFSAMLFGAGVIVVLRMIAAHYQWQLPRA